MKSIRTDYVCFGHLIGKLFRYFPLSRFRPAAAIAAGAADSNVFLCQPVARKKQYHKTIE